MSLTIAICSHNQAEQLDACLKSALFADEIVVLLDRCSDHSTDICARYHITPIHGSWPQEGQRRNTALQHCQSDWILELDTDEEITPALQQELQRISQNAATQAHSVDLNNYIGKRLIKYGWGPTCFGIPGKISLFPRNKKHYATDTMDAHVAYTLACPVGPTLTNPLNHYREKNISEVLQRLDRYTTLRANEWLRSPQKIQPLRTQIRRFFTYFYKSYVRRKGYREGIYGLLIGLCAALYFPLAYIKVKATPDMLTNHQENRCD